MDDGEDVLDAAARAIAGGRRAAAERHRAASSLSGASLSGASSGGHASAGLDAAAPEFVPAGRTPASSSSSAAAAAPRSLIFGGGGNFLAKYGHLRLHEEGTNGSQPRRRAAAPGQSPHGPAAGGASAAPRTGAGAVQPDRANVQLNTLLVNARSSERIMQVVEAHFEDFNAVNLITAMHRLATASVSSRRGQLRRDVRFKRVLARLAETVRYAQPGELKPQDLSNIAWALSRLGILDADLFERLSEHIRRTIHLFEPVNVSMTLWAFARSGFLDEKLSAAAAQEVKGQLARFEPQQIANTTWALAKSGFVDQELFEQAAELALARVGEFQPMNYSMLLYSFALAKLRHDALFAEVARRCTATELASATSMAHVVTNLAMAYAEAGAPGTEVFEAIASAASGALADFRTQQIATLVTCFAKAQVRHSRLFDAVSRAVVRRMPELRQQDLEEIMRAFDELGFSTKPMVRASQAMISPDKPETPGPCMVIAFLIATVVMLLLALAAAWPVPAGQRAAVELAAAAGAAVVGRLEGDTLAAGTLRAASGEA